MLNTWKGMYCSRLLVSTSQERRIADIYWLSHRILSALSVFSLNSATHPITGVAEVAQTIPGLRPLSAEHPMVTV